MRRRSLCIIYVLALYIKDFQLNVHSVQRYVLMTSSNMSDIAV